jgi:hypothetical protein
VPDRGALCTIIHTRPKNRAKGDPAMKKYFILGFATLLLVGMAGVTPAAKAQSTATAPAAAPAPAASAPASAPGRPLRIVLSRQSTVDPVEIVKHLSQKCPNVTLTSNSKDSDFMLHAGGWSGNYRFMVIAHGGNMIYATETSLLSNAVKDVCKFLNTQAPRGSTSSY